MYGIYIHIPFCAQKCSYCDFLSFPTQSYERKKQYIKAIIKELTLKVNDEWYRPISIFIGGGTPTVLDSILLDELMKGIHQTVDMSVVKEFTVEANPGTIDEKKIKVLKNAGVNRLSFGVQSFDKKMLQLLERVHSVEEVEQAVMLAKKYEIQNINLDLMYGLPYMKQKTWEDTLKKAVALEPAHLSLYQLIVEPHTKIAHMLDSEQLPMIDDDLAAMQFDWQREWLAEKGYYQYEISNYAKKGCQSVHNKLYWHLKNYLGIGLGATSWRRPVRYKNTEDFYGYVSALHFNNKLSAQESEKLSLQEQMSESIFMGLRLNEGVCMETFEKIYNISLQEHFKEAIDEGIKKGWLFYEDDFLRLTNKGRRMGNWVFELFL